MDKHPPTPIKKNEEDGDDNSYLDGPGGMFSADAAASKGRQQRSDSYLGRIRNFLGFNPSA